MQKDGVKKTLINTKTKDTKRNKQNGILFLLNEFNCFTIYNYVVRQDGFHRKYWKMIDIQYQPAQN